MRRLGTTGFALIVGLAACNGESERSAEERPARSGKGTGFTEITAEAGLGSFRHVNGADGRFLFPETMSGGLAFIDYDNDGWQDLLVVGGGRWRSDHEVDAVRLFRNTGGGRFTDVTTQTGLAGIRAYGMGIAVADYDNDGDPDFFLSSVHRDFLFRNHRTPTGHVFREVGQHAGVAGDSLWSTSAVFFDANDDGWVDLFVGRYVAWSVETDLWCRSGGKKSYCTPEVYSGIRPAFYLNRGDGTFTEATDDFGLSLRTGKMLGVAVFDFDGDSRTDLFVANDTEPDVLFRNEGGRFVEVGVAAGIAYDDRGRARAGMGIDVGCVDSSGLPAMFVGNFANEMIGVYQYLGNGVFRDRAAVSRIGGSSRRTLAFGLFLFDFDLDGDLDLFVANGHIIPEVDTVDDDISFRQAPHLFQNDGNGTFRDVAPQFAPALSTRLVGRGAAYADIDLDGDLDVAVVENGGGVRLYRNEARNGETGPNYLRLNLDAPRTPTLGTRATAFVNGSAQVRYVRSGSSYLSQSELPITFGLGAAETVDSLQVVWPDGAIEVRTGVDANQILTVSRQGN